MKPEKQAEFTAYKRSGKNPLQSGSRN